MNGCRVGFVCFDAQMGAAGWLTQCLGSGESGLAEAAIGIGVGIAVFVVGFDVVSIDSYWQHQSLLVVAIVDWDWFAFVLVQELGHFWHLFCSSALVFP